MAMTMSERGRLGGKATAAKGRDYMSKIGKRGFKALCRKFPGNSRRYALMHLNGKGKIKARFVPRKDPTTDQEFEALYEALAPEEVPF